MMEDREAKPLTESESLVSIDVDWPGVFSGGLRPQQVTFGGLS